MRTPFSVMLFGLETLVMYLAFAGTLGTLVTLTARWEQCGLDVATASSGVAAAVLALALHITATCVRRHFAVSTLVHRDIALALVGHTFCSVVAYFLMHAQQPGGLRVTLCTALSTPFAVLVTVLTYLAAFIATPENASVPLWLTPENLLLTACVLFSLLQRDAEEHPRVPTPVRALHALVERHVAAAFPTVGAEGATRVAVCVLFLAPAIAALLVTAFVQDALPVFGVREARLALPRCGRLVVTAAYAAVMVAAEASPAMSAVAGWVCVGLVGASVLLQVLALHAVFLRLTSDALLLAACALFSLTHSDTARVAALLPFPSIVPYARLREEAFEQALRATTAEHAARLAVSVWFLPLSLAAVLVAELSHDTLAAVGAPKGERARRPARDATVVLTGLGAACLLVPLCIRLAASAVYLTVATQAVLAGAIGPALGWVCVGMLAASALMQVGALAAAIARRDDPVEVPAATAPELEQKAVVEFLQAGAHVKIS